MSGTRESSLNRQTPRADRSAGRFLSPRFLVLVAYTSSRILQLVRESVSNCFESVGVRNPALRRASYAPSRFETTYVAWRRSIMALIFPANNSSVAKTRNAHRGESARAAAGRTRGERAQATHDEVDLHLNAVRGTGMVDEDEVPLAQGIVIDAIL